MLREKSQPRRAINDIYERQNNYYILSYEDDLHVITITQIKIQEAIKAHIFNETSAKEYSLLIKV
jgi:hypothetical protein